VHVCSKSAYVWMAGICSSMNACTFVHKYEHMYTHRYGITCVNLRACICLFACMPVSVSVHVWFASLLRGVIMSWMLTLLEITAHLGVLALLGVRSAPIRMISSSQTSPYTW
jgi:hypothetical protein